MLRMQIVQFQEFHPFLSQTNVQNHTYAAMTNMPTIIPFMDRF
jgi:hypothetical protein